MGPQARGAGPVLLEVLRTFPAEAAKVPKTPTTMETMFSDANSYRTLCQAWLNAFDALREIDPNLAAGYEESPDYKSLQEYLHIDLPSQ